MLAQRLLSSGSAGVSRHLPFDVEQPAVEGAAQAAVLEPAVGEIGAAMRAVAADQAVAALLVAEEHEVLAEQPDRLDRAVAGKLVDQRRRLPVAPHQAARRRARPGAGDEIVLLRAQHRQPPLHADNCARSTYTKSAIGQSSRRMRATQNGRRKAGRIRDKRAKSSSGWRAAQPVSMRRRQAVWRRPSRRCAAVFASARLAAAQVRYSRSDDARHQRLLAKQPGEGADAAVELQLASAHWRRCRHGRRRRRARSWCGALRRRPDRSAPRRARRSAHREIASNCSKSDHENLSALIPETRMHRTRQASYWFRRSTGPAVDKPPATPAV